MVAPDRLVEEFFRTEVLDVLRPEEAQLLISSSVLERLSGPLCDAILGRRRSGAMLDRLERTNLFLIPLDQRSDLVPVPSPPRRLPAGRAGTHGSRGRRRSSAGGPAPGTRRTACPRRPWSTPWRPATRTGRRALTVTLGAGRHERRSRPTPSVAGSAGSTTGPAGDRHPRLAAYAGDGLRPRRRRQPGGAMGGHRGSPRRATMPTRPMPGCGPSAGPSWLVTASARMVEDAELAARIIPDGDSWRVAAAQRAGHWPASSRATSRSPIGCWRRRSRAGTRAAWPTRPSAWR